MITESKVIELFCMAADLASLISILQVFLLNKLFE